MKNKGVLPKKVFVFNVMVILYCSSKVCMRKNGCCQTSGGNCDDNYNFAQHEIRTYGSNIQCDNKQGHRRILLIFLRPSIRCKQNQQIDMDYFCNSICRLCLNSEGTLNIFNKMNTTVSCAEKVLFCTRIMIKNIDNLPNMICKGCIQQLDAAYQFRVQVINSDYKLRNAIKDLENLNDSEIFSNEILQISLHNPEENINFEIKTTAEDVVKLSKPNDAKQDQIEPRIGIIKLGEDSRGEKSKKVKNLLCETCGKKFNKSNQLFVHTRVHTKEKPYCCEICKQSFVHSHHLKSHRRIHASDPQERKPYICKYCKKMFSENSSLSRHLKIHENVKVFMCSFCTKKFITLADVRNHLVSHSGSKPYQCKLCDRKYSNPSNLSKHKKKHCKTLTNAKVL